MELRLSRSGQVVALIFPAIVLVTLTVIAPICASLVESLTHNGSLSLENYRLFFQRPQYLQALKNTLFIAGSAASLTVALAFPACAFISRQRPWAQGIFLATIALSFAISGLVRTLSWQIMLGRQGPLNWVLQTVGLADTPLETLYTRSAVIIGSAHIMLPVAAALIFAGMKRIDHAFVLAARTLGASQWQTFRSAYWPQISGSVVNAWLMVFTLTTGFFITAALLGGPSEVILGTLMQSDLMFDIENGVGLASTSGVVLGLTLAVIYFAVGRLAGAAFYRRGGGHG
ncbi:ABC transporter permease [Agrobacterium tumefaciens]|uniref:ABC transporter permease n=1 Tax=Agrobacterium tumefaciens TaxID=358 RepID=UPI001571B202|nr:ABC transporter permease [Agrobacterium tumefaciens]